MKKLLLTLLLFIFVVSMKASPKNQDNMLTNQSVLVIDNATAADFNEQIDCWALADAVETIVSGSVGSNYSLWEAVYWTCQCMTGDTRYCN